jgi:hypothetical protein
MVPYPTVKATGERMYIGLFLYLVSAIIIFRNIKLAGVPKYLFSVVVPAFFLFFLAYGMTIFYVFFPDSWLLAQDVSHLSECGRRKIGCINSGQALYIIWSFFVPFLLCWFIYRFILKIQRKSFNKSNQRGPSAGTR